MQDITDEVIKKAVGGDVDAYEKIYKAFFSFVSNVAFRVVNVKQDAEDITQEVFVTLYHQLKNFRFDSSLKTWVYRITVNTAINYAKRSNKYKHQPLEFNEDVAHEEAETNEDKEFTEKVVAALLESLNPDQRACIVLRSIENLSYEEIAQALKIPINTVRSRIKRARETMMAIKHEVIKNEM